jgi:hypothetical protein
MEFKSLFADAVSYWERKRIIYNGVLVILVAACWGGDILSGGPQQWLGAAFVLFLFAGVANALYCFAYPVDLAFQMTPLKECWQRFRWLLFATGVILASILSLWIMLRQGMG